MDIEQHIKEWRESDDRECNNPEFIATFIEYMKDKDRAYEFRSGENGYCGYSAWIYDSYSPFGSALFELAYRGNGFVKVFAADNDGYWVPEYISLSGDAASEILDILKSKLLEFGGFNN